MSDAERILERMRQTQADWTPNDFKKVYEANGFEKIEAANHTTYRHPKHGFITQVPRHKPVKKCYTRIAIDLIDKAIQLDENENGNE